MDNTASYLHAQILLRPAHDGLATGATIQGQLRFTAELRGFQPSTKTGISQQRYRSVPRIGAAELPATRGTSRRGTRQEYELIRQEADALDRQLGLVRRIVKFASPSIVHIEATKTSDPGKGFASSRIEEAGAGVVINLRGSAYVLTNRHVIYPASIASIRLELNDGRRLRPLDVWTDPSTDVAIIRIEENDLTQPCSATATPWRLAITSWLWGVLLV